MQPAKVMRKNNTFILLNYIHWHEHSQRNLINKLLINNLAAWIEDVAAIDIKHDFN